MSTRQVIEHLRNEGFEVTPRTVERDLDKLSAIFGYTVEQDGRQNLWFWPADFGTMDVPGLNPSTAIAFSLARGHLTELLPPGTSALLEPYFRRAEEVLDGASSSKLGSWRDKVRAVGVGPFLTPASTSPEIQQTAYEALLHERRLLLDYQPRGESKSKTYEFSPLALVSRQGVLYLVGPFWDYNNPVQVTLHRITSASLLETSIHKPSGFDIDRYIGDAGGFNYPTGGGTISVELLFEPETAQHLEERPLSTDQRLSEDDNGRVRLTATVLETDDLIWWILGFGAKVEVKKPRRLRQRVSSALAEAAAQYSN
ncbi:helix-turn-helix transcriptional regulator [Spectribacter hydrogenooxidans]|uniref:WYL domain-containing protein n=1 Tax=Spectribacter hydrogenoxidans TaxID=3075608 RepID=A0ABU3C407_9GAMM|nr:WYL domain-containing protein [Salinisphaera sp. W335]MDT0636296.1 WYL domain-containing protein [Salinisphaera sp. W335]